MNLFGKKNYRIDNSTIKREARRMKARRTLIALVITLAVVTIATAQDNAGRKLKDTLTVALWEEPSTLDPQASNRISWSTVELNIFDKLVYQDGDGKVYPRLATEWKFLDDLTLEMKLRKDVTFHDGSKFTAEDVLFSFKRAKANPVSASTFDFFDPDKTVIVDPYTIRLKFKFPNAAVFNTFASLRGGIVSKSAVTAMGDAAYARKPIGTGPYKLVSWKSGTEIAMVRNDNYWGEKAFTKNLIFKFIPEAGNRVIELETGGVDAIFEVSSSDVPRIEKLKNAHVLMGPSNKYITLTFSMKDPILSNKDVRYALSYAIDKKGIVDAVYKGTVTVATGMYPSNVFAFKEEGMMPYDLAKAKEYLAKAGYPQGFSMNFLIDPDEASSRIAEIVQNMWEKIGVKVSIFQMVSSTYVAQGNKYQAAMRSGNANEPSNILIIYDSAFKERLEPNDPWIDAKLKAAKTYYDDKKRAAAYQEIQDYLYDARYTVPLAFTSVIYGLSNGVEGWTCDPLQQVEMKNVKVYQ
jgi:peptide/nickel transport system substrate-binding protein